jgi:hypothetical protein
VLFASDDETRQLLDVDLLLQVTIQKCRFDVHMIHLSPLVHCEGDKQAHRVQPSHRREDFIVVNAMSLCIALHHKACLMFGHRPILILLHLEYPLHPNRLAIG